jgi:Ca-activated chloride channel family protein
MAGRHSAAGRDPNAFHRPQPHSTGANARHAVPPPAAPGGRRTNSGHDRANGRTRRRAFVAVVATCAIAAGIIVAATWPDNSGHAGARATGVCQGEVKVHVIAAPSIAPAITTIARQWQASHPAVDGTCVGVSVVAQDSRTAEGALVNVSTGVAWIPDSTVWSSRLTSEASGLTLSHLTVGRSVAKSPLVLAVSPARSPTVIAAAKRGWVAALSGSMAAAVADPTTTTEGALTLLSLQSELGTSSAGASALGSALLEMSQRVMPNAAAGFAAVTDFPTTAPAFVASEQAVMNANAGKTKPITAAVYPSGASPALDFPFVTITPSPVSLYARALQQFGRYLGQPAAVHALNAVHLRGATSAPLQLRSDASGAGSQPVSLIAQPTPVSVTSVLRRWVAVGAPNQFLTVIDVSGSMKDDSGNGQSKIQVAADAATAAVTLMPDAWAAGLWIFSLKPAPANDWTELVPLGSLRSNRSALLSAARDMPSRAVGDTALYSTALAAFTSVGSHYEPDKVNSVLLMTDGANTDPDDSSLPALIAALKQRFDPKRPVNIDTIALGADADVSALKQISAATGGHTYVVRSAQDIRTVFVRVALGSS